MKIPFTNIIVLGISVLFCYGFSIKLEKHYQAEWAKLHNGITELRLSDAARVDIVTDTHAIEVDYAKKWAESIGQALYYSAMTGKQAGVLLIVGRGDAVFKARLDKAIEYHKLPITVWYTEK